jgi:hypothetical protein
MITYERSTLVNSEKYIALDVHQATIWVAVLDSTGKVVMESTCGERCAPSYWQRAEKIKPRNCCARFPASGRFGLPA